MTYLELYEHAKHELNHNRINLGEWSEMIEPLRREIEEPKTGHWIETGAEELPFGMTLKELTCSECGWNSALMIPRNHCPKCGVKMKGVKNDTQRQH